MGVPKPLYQERLKLGLCPWCGKSRDGKTHLCRACARLHAQRTKRWRDKRKRHGICTRCSRKARPGRQYCQRCATYVTQASGKNYNGRRNAGLCVWCPAPNTVGRFCKRCWFRGCSLSLFKTTSRGAELEALFRKQLGKCFYTRERLVPGKNTAIDHRTPRSRGGADTIDNLQWVTIRINRVKNDLTHEEFVSLCTRIARMA